jgi:hypothetical protein
MAGRKPAEDPASFDARVLRQLLGAPGPTAYQLARCLGLIDEFGRPKERAVRRSLDRLEAGRKVEHARIERRIIWRAFISCPACHGQSQNCLLCGGAGMT